MRVLCVLVLVLGCMADPGSDGGSFDGGGLDVMTETDVGAEDDAPDLDAPPRTHPSGPPGCGLAAAALCDTFDDVAPEGLGEGRAGELDPRIWSGARAMPGRYPDRAAVPVPPAHVSGCRPGLPESVYPGQDALVCDGTDAIPSRHLMTLAAEQSYGQLSLRARQPFDFADREGRIVFDADVDGSNALHGWVSIAVTEDPSPAPSFGIENNFENGAIPRRGIEVHLYQLCGAMGGGLVGVGHVSVFEDWAEHATITGAPSGPLPTCVSTRDGSLNHFEVRLSRTHLEVWASEPADATGVLPPATRIYTQDLDLPFERGYVHFSTHNHSTLKYSANRIDAFVVRWDNLAFDGPVIDGWREHSIADSMTLTHQDITADPFTLPFDCMNTGYPVDESPTAFRFSGVSTAGVTRASVALDAWVQTIGVPPPYSGYVLRYRTGGGAWHDYTFPPGQLVVVTEPDVTTSPASDHRRTESIGLFSAVLPFDPSELTDGDVTLEIATQGIPLGWAPYVTNLDLVLGTE